MPIKRYRNYCFTSFAATLTTEHELIRYICWGEETCENGRKHLQGYVELNAALGLTRVKQVLGDQKLHLEPRKGTQLEAIEYCKKEGSFQEHGRVKKQGERTDLKREDIMELIDEGAQKLDIFALNPEAAYTNDRFIEYYTKMKHMEGEQKYLKEAFPEDGLRPLQQKWLDRLERQNDRQINWVFDPEGNSGKSWFANWLVVNRSAVVFENGKTRDIAEAYNSEPIVVFDFTRSLEGHVNYGALESIKNGRIFSPKYQSKMKFFKPPKVLVVANFKPEIKKLSKDRWWIQPVIHG